MTFRPLPGVRYDMPVVFGPSLIPDETVYNDVEIVSVSYHTSIDAVAELLPYHLHARDEPVVTISRMTYDEVDFLDGRSYSEVTVGITAEFDEDGTTRRGSYQPVLWIDDAVGMTAGREYFGYAKVMGTLPEVVRQDDRCEFDVLDRDERLLACRVRDLRPLTASELESVQRASQRTIVFGWKYIPGPGRTVDADYITEIPLSFTPTEGWTGSGSVDWTASGEISSALPARIVKVLSSLPIRAYRPAFVGRGPGRFVRGSSRRLYGEGSGWLSVTVWLKGRRGGRPRRS